MSDIFTHIRAQGLGPVGTGFFFSAGSGASRGATVCPSDWSSSASFGLRALPGCRMGRLTQDDLVHRVPGPVEDLERPTGATVALDLDEIGVAPNVP